MLYENIMQNFGDDATWWDQSVIAKYIPCNVVIFSQFI